MNINRYQLNGAMVFSNDRDLVIPGIWHPHVYYGLEEHSDGAFAFEPSKQITHPDYSEGLSAEVVAHYRANGDCAMLAAAMAEEIRTD